LVACGAPPTTRLNPILLDSARLRVEEPSVKTIVEGSGAGGFVPLTDDGLRPEVAALLSGPLGPREEVEEELDGILVAVRTFWMKEPDQVMREISAYSARLTELAVQLARVEYRQREYTKLRTMQVERLLAELERQYKIASRSVEVRRQDLELLRGAP
jgi:hypothetical protein